MVFKQIAFNKQLIRLFYPVLMLEKEVEWWSLLSALIIYWYCLQILVASLKFVNNKLDKYLLTLKIALRCMLLAMNKFENFLVEEF